MHRERRHGRQLIGVAINSVPLQMHLEAGRWQHHALDDILAGIRAHADTSDLDVLLFTALSSEVTGEATHYGDLCRAHGAEGIILVSFVPEEPELNELAESEFPCVSIDTRVFGSRASFIMTDNMGGAVEAVRHLAGLGRKRIAFIGGWGHELVSLERQLGYNSVLEDLGLERREDYVLKGGWLHGQAHSETLKALALAEPPDAFFCASDRMAVGTMLACEEAGLQIPEDVAVVGFDDEGYAALLSPSLTTVRQDRVGVGTAAVEALLKILDDPGAQPTSLAFPVELVIRESTDPTRRAGSSRRRWKHLGTADDSRSQRSFASSVPMRWSDRKTWETRPAQSTSSGCPRNDEQSPSPPTPRPSRATGTPSSTRPSTACARALIRTRPT